MKRNQQISAVLMSASVIIWSQIGYAGPNDTYDEAVQKGINYLEQRTQAFNQSNTCVSCHINGLSLAALSEMAMSPTGYVVDLSTPNGLYGQAEHIVNFEVRNTGGNFIGYQSAGQSPYGNIPNYQRSTIGLTLWGLSNYDRLVDPSFSANVMDAADYLVTLQNSATFFFDPGAWPEHWDPRFSDITFGHVTTTAWAVTNIARARDRAQLLLSFNPSDPALLARVASYDASITLAKDFFFARRNNHAFRYMTNDGIAMTIIAYLASGDAPDSADVQFFVNKMYSEQGNKVGWGLRRSQSNPANAYFTSQAVYALCLAGQRPNDVPELQAAVDQLNNWQQTVTNPVTTLEEGSWPSPNISLTREVTTSWAMLALDCIVNSGGAQVQISNGCDVPPVGATNVFDAVITGNLPTPLTYQWTSTPPGVSGTGSSYDTANLTQSGTYDMTVTVTGSDNSTVENTRTIYVGQADCNGNCVLDTQDISNGTSQDLLPPFGVPDECQPPDAGVVIPDSGPADPPDSGVADPDAGFTWNEPVDSYPCRRNAVSTAYEPSSQNYGSIMFEDKWPITGDSDFNDAVFGWNFLYRVNGSGLVDSLRIFVAPLAAGGGYHDGLGLHLPIPKSEIVQATITRDFITRNLQPAAADDDLVLVLAQDIRTFFNNQNGAVNSRGDRARIPGGHFEVNISFRNPQALAIGSAPFDLFLFRSGRPSHEIHRPDFNGTAGMDTSLFGTGNDNSQPGRSFVDGTGLPFSLTFPRIVLYPGEGTPISTLYPDIVPFAASNGTTNQDFYETNVNSAAAYQDRNGVGALTPPTITPEAPLTCSGPVVNAGPDQSINEGDVFMSNGSWANIQGSQTFFGTVDYGDGTPVQNLTLTYPTTAFQLNHTYLSSGSFTVTVSITNESNVTGTDTVTVTVGNIDPTVAVTTPLNVQAGQTAAFSGSFVDPGNDTWTGTVDYGDGSNGTLTLQADKSFTATHMYASPGSYSVTFTVTDSDGGVGTQTINVTVAP